MSERLHLLAAAQSSRMLRARRAMHELPEVGLALPRTQDLILGELADLPLEITLGRELSSVTAVLRGAHAGPTVLLRADMDALPIREQTGLSFRSRIDGAMHACGHDLHTAMLIGAAHVLCELRSSLAGSVVFMFQPGEEGHYGAERMVAEGVLTASGELPIAAYALHVMATPWRRGIFSVGSGPIMASADRVDIVMCGRGGHASTPHLAGGALAAAATAVVELPSAILHARDPLSSAVFNIGAIHSGTEPNVIPTEAAIAATLRTFDNEVRHRSLETITRVCEGAAVIHGAAATVRVTPRYAATANTPDEAFRCLALLEALFPERAEELVDPLFGSEDFSVILREVPGVMTFLGASADGVDNGSWNHAPDVVFDESILPDGAAYYAAMALRHLAPAILRQT